MKKIFIANRSEVVRRIQATCRFRGLETVSVFEARDALSAYVAASKQAYPLSGIGFEAYQAQEELITLALNSGADAVHPGYGFLAENWLFAQKVIDAGLMWIGPHPRVIAAMGDKCEATKIAKLAGLPVIPSVAIDSTASDSFEAALSEARKIGFPILLKDPLSGGGKGIVLVEDASLFEAAWNRICSESKRLTGSHKIVVEKFFRNIRHIEVQVAGDGKSWIHLYERECSIQRRHQKIIEEAPSCFVHSSTLEKMYKASLDLAAYIGYTSLGTVEFIVTSDEQFYFLEMNTRLQVEHSITELTTGIDLVDLQLVIAQTGVLPIQQQSVIRRGHAIECRVYAESPQKNFMPMTGTITHLRFPTLPFGRIDHDLYEGYEVSSFFDPMIAKVSTYASNRDDCVRRMIAALDDFVIDGVETNNHFLVSILRHERFSSGDFSTQLLAEKLFREELFVKDQTDCNDFKQIALIAAAMKNSLFEERKVSCKKNSSVFDGWRERLWE